MSVEQFTRVIDEFAVLKPQVYLHVLGEPLLHKDLERFLDIADSYGLVVNVTTNGTLLADKGDILLTHNAVRKVSISVHCLEGRSDDKARQYIDNIAEFGIKANIQGRPIVNYRMWTGGQDFLAQRNDDNVQILISKFGGVQEDSYMDGYHSFNLGERVYVCYDSEFEWPSVNNEEVAQYGKCLGGRDMLAVLVDGTVTACCLDSEGQIVLGNIFNDSLADIMNSDRYRALITGFTGGRISEELCRKCRYRLRFDKKR